MSCGKSVERSKRMRHVNVEDLVNEKEELTDLLEDIVTRIQEIREEFLSELDDLESMITEK